ncbi:MAG: vWA domain-containing protein [Methanothrix sp.]
MPSLPWSQSGEGRSNPQSLSSLIAFIKFMRHIYTALILMLVLSICAQSQPDTVNKTVERSTVMLFDASESMEDNNKIDSAKTAVREFVSGLDPATDELALIVFYDCEDIVVEQPFTSDQSALTSKIDAIRPTGKTPLSAAMAFAKNYIEDNANGTEKKIIQLTDGTETCTRRTISNNTQDMDINIIGFDILSGSDQETELMDYAQSIGADYINAGNASNSSDLANILQRAYGGTAKTENLEAIQAQDEEGGLNLSQPSSGNNISNASDVQAEPDGAITAGVEVSQLNSSDPSYWINMGNALLAQGKYDEAVKAYDEALKLNASDPLSWKGKADALFALGRYDEAIQAYDEAIKLNTSEPLSWKGKADALFALGRYEEAIQAYDEAIKLNPSEPLSWKGKADALFALGQYDEAVAAYDEAIKLNTSDPLSWKGKADALFALGKYDEAVAAYDEAIKLNTSDPLSWKGKADALFALGRHEEAAKAYDEAIKIDPASSPALEGKTRALEALGQLDSAVKSIGQLSGGAAEGISSSPSQPGIIGSIYSGANVPKKDKFVCNLMSACGMYPLGLGNNGDGATANLAAFSFGKVGSG